MSCSDSCGLPQSKDCPFCSEIGQSQRLQSLGLMLGEIVHDLNNVLALGLGHADLALEDVPDSHARLREHLSLIKGAFIDCGDLCRSLLTYAGRSQGGPSAFSPVMLVQELSRLLRIRIPDSVMFTVQTESDAPEVIADSMLLRQIILNLVLNASEALCGTGEDEIQLRVSCLRRGVAHYKYSSDYVLEVEVRDNGCGMSADVVEKLGEPYFTTKVTGRGLGLAAVKQLVAAAGGMFSVKSAPGEGSVFVVSLPASRCDADELAVKDTNAKECDIENGKVLVVDDEESLLRIHGTILERAGFQVLRATNSKDAAQLFQRHQEDVGVVFLDILIGGGDGATLSRTLRAMRDDIPLVVLSGCSARYIQEKYGACFGPDEVLIKPVSASVLRAAACRWFRVGA